MWERFEYVALFEKASRRKDNISIATAGIRIRLVLGKKEGVNNC